MKKIILSIDGMSCEHCVKHVKETLNELSGVVAVDVTLSPPEANIHAGKELKNACLLEAVEEAGYSASVSSETAE